MERKSRIPDWVDELLGEGGVDVKDRAKINSKEEVKKFVSEMKSLRRIRMFVAYDVMLMILEKQEGYENHIDIMHELSSLKAEKQINIYTTNANVLHALYVAEADSKIDELQKLLSIVHILPSDRNYKDKIAIDTENKLITRHIASGGKMPLD